MDNEILNTIDVPIENQSSMVKIIEHCLLKDGQNKKHSRSLILDGYRKPANSNLSTEDEEKYNIGYCFMTLKYFAEKYLKDLKKLNADLNKPVSSYFPEISNKDITGKDLEYVCTHNYDELIAYNKANIKLPLSKLIWSFLNNNGIDAEHFNNELLYEDKTFDEGEQLFWGYSKRIYMNLPRNSSITYDFGLQYVMKCIDRKIPFDMKLFGAFGHGDNNLDGTIFYSKNKYFNDHIAILNEILEEHPEYKQYFGTPIYTAGHVIDSDGNCYIAISHGGNSYFSTTLRRVKTYNDTADDIINFTYTLACCKLIKYFATYFIKKIDSNLFKSISDISTGFLNFNSLSDLEKIENIIRKEVYNFIADKKKQNDVNYVMEKFSNYMISSLPSISSLVNFGDLNHTNEPMYKDYNFLLYEQNYNKSSSLK